MTSFVITFQDGSFLRPCLGGAQTLTTTVKDEAKQFTDEMRARSWATLLGGCIEELETQFEMACFLKSEESEMNDLEKVLECLIGNAGGIFQGLQTGHPRHSALILFADSQAPKDKRATVAIPFYECSSERIKTRLTELRQKFAPKVQEASA